tara:strand:+ start:34448 stop:34984 length:537 start_codon:yes stop_codon:yes gene_type:complete
MNFCNECGHKVVRKVPKGDNRPRYSCENCDTIFYQNPKIISGTVTIQDNQILLCKRAIEPRYGLWTIPAGFLENKETIEEGCLRETLEETNAEVKIQSLYAIFNIPQISQIYMLYLAHLGQQEYGSTTESLEVKLFKEQDIPWDQLAFPFVPKILKYIFTDIKNNEFPLRIETIERKK